MMREADDISAEELQRPARVLAKLEVARTVGVATAIPRFETTLDFLLFLFSRRSAVAHIIFHRICNFQLHLHLFVRLPRPTLFCRAAKLTRALLCELGEDGEREVRIGAVREARFLARDENKTRSRRRGPIEHAVGEMEVVCVLVSADIKLTRILRRKTLRILLFLLLVVVMVV